MPYHVGLEGKVQRGVTTSWRPGLSEATRALTDPGAPEKAGKIHVGDDHGQVTPSLSLFRCNPKVWQEYGGEQRMEIFSKVEQQ